MRRGRGCLFGGFGLALFFGLMVLAVVLYAVPVQSTVGPAMEVVEGVGMAGGGGMMMFPWVLVAIPIFLIIAGRLAFAFARRANYGRSSAPRKRKPDYEYDADDWTAQEMNRLEDEGDLPELTEDDLYVDDKPKRTFEDW